jgi:AcrR family transcriptional regulator
MPRATWHNLEPDRRERVMRAAMAEFGRHGYSGGSLNVIAREAGVAKGSLFQYFDDKFDFFAHVAEQTALTIYAALLPHLAGPRPGQPFADYFAATADAWIGYLAAHPLERGVTAATNMELDPHVRRAVHQPMYGRYARALRPLLETAAQSGELAPDTDVEALLALLILLLAHLSLAPFEPGLDGAPAWYGTRKAQRTAAAHRLVTALLAPHRAAIDA